MIWKIICLTWEIIMYPYNMIGLHSFYNTTIKINSWLNESKNIHKKSEGAITYIKMHGWHSHRLTTDKRITRMVI